MVSTLLTVAELLFYKKVVSVQIKNSIQNLTDSASILGSFTKEQMEDSEKMSLAFSRTFADNEGKIDEIVGKAKSKLETVDKKEVYAKLNDLSSMGDPIELIKGAIGQDNLDEANKYIDIIIENEEALNDKINTQCYTAGWFIVVFFASLVYIFRQYGGGTLEKGARNAALVTVFFLMVFQIYFYELTSNSFGYLKGSEVLYPSKNVIKQNVLKFLSS